MPYQNLSFNLTNSDRDQIIQKMEEIRILMPFVVNLSKADKKLGRKLGAKSEKLFIDTLFVLESNPQLAPAFVSTPEYVQDLDSYIDLLGIELKLKSLVESVAETRLALGQEMMRPTLALYSNVKEAAKANVAGSGSALERLQPYFKVQRKKK